MNKENIEQQEGDGSNQQEGGSEQMETVAENPVVLGRDNAFLLRAAESEAKDHMEKMKRLFIQDARNADYFTFTAADYIDHVYNIMVKSWEKVVKETTMPGVLAVCPSMDAKAQKMLADQLYNAIYQNGRLAVILDQAKEFAVEHVFNIPEYVTLEKDQRWADEAKRLESLNVNMVDVRAECEKLEEEIIQLRIGIMMKEQVTKANEQIRETLAEAAAALEYKKSSDERILALFK